MEKLDRLHSLIRGAIRFKQLASKKQMSLGSILERQAKKFRDKPLILFEDRKISWTHFNEEANRYAHLFLKRGFRKGDTVVILMDNRPEYLMAHAGLAKIGVIPALVNTHIKGQALAHAINIADAKAVITGIEYLDVCQKIKDEVKLKEPAVFFVETEHTSHETTIYMSISSGSMPSGFEDLKHLLSAEPVTNPSVYPALNSRDTLEYIYTSGTTGLPKATELKHQKWIQLGYGSGGIALRATSDDIMYLCLPLYHNSGINIAWSVAVTSGGTIAIRRKFSASHFWDDIRKYRATLFIYIGELCRYLNNQPERKNDSDNTLKYILGNGMRGDYWTEFQKRFGIEKIIEVYGATEGVGALANFRGIPGMIGRLSVAGVKMGEVVKYDMDNDQIMKDSRGFAIKCRPGETGLFLASINKLNPFSGYKNNRSATESKIIRDVFKKGDMFFISGDLFRLHKKGYVSFVDRLGDTFKWKGEVVATNEVSDILNRFGGFEDCNVYGVSVGNTEGRAGMAALTFSADSYCSAGSDGADYNNSDFNLKEFASYVRENLPVYARPYFLRICSEKHTTASFKQVKSHLQKEGFSPAIISEPLYFLDPEKCEYVELTQKIYEEIEKGAYRF